MKKQFTSLLTILIWLSFFSLFNISVLNVSASVSKTMWLGYKLTNFLEYNSSSIGYHSIPLSGANGTLCGIWNQRLYGFTASDPVASSQKNQSLYLAAAFGGFADVLTRANFIKNALIGYGEVDANTACPYGYLTPHKISYVGYIDAYQKVFVLTTNMNRTLASPPNNNPLCFWATAGHNVNVTWDATRNAYTIEGVTGFPHIVFGTLSPVLYRQMKEYVDVYECFWWWGPLNRGGEQTIQILRYRAIAHHISILGYNSIALSQLSTTPKM